MTNEQKIWAYLKSHSPWTEYGIAGLMGNLRAESALKPENIENAYEAKIGYTDETYCAAVDAGKISEDEFAKAGWGIGLAQWTYHTRRRALYRYAKAQGKSIADLEMQCAFLIKEITEGYSAVDKVLRTATDVKTASNVVLKQYENPAVQTTAVQNVRHGYGVTIYNNNHVADNHADEDRLATIVKHLETVDGNMAAIMTAINDIKKLLK